MKTITINLDHFENKRDFHLYLKEQCEFPEYYGCNLDALYDCLSDNNQFIFEVYESHNFTDYLDYVLQVFYDTNCVVKVMNDGQEIK